VADAVSAELPGPDDRLAADAWRWYRRYRRWGERADTRGQKFPNGEPVGNWCRARADRQLHVFLTLMKGGSDGDADRGTPPEGP
jgi:hypothetical protein